ncbi:MAG: ribonuclease HII [Alphaproteobacteria bacterium]|nr:ribonuclease HII [Alphaproteobacteria bacterium]
MTWYEENNISIENSIGIDEVGRGPLAGPVVAAAVWISDALAFELERGKLVVRDSKKMTAKQRARVVEWADDQHYDFFRYSIGHATVEEIDELNILNAALLAMKRAYESLGIQKEYVIVDGNKTPKIDAKSVIPIVGGDNKVLSISLASIIAKEYRDSLMKKLALEYPYYGWSRNVGYGSKEHIEAILKFGITPYHRKTFAPIKDMSFS